MARMARGAFEQRSPHSDRITPLLFKAAVILAVAAALYAVSYGVPLSGLPEAKEMERLHIIFVPTNETRIFDVTEDITLAEDIKLALEAAEQLRVLPFRPRSGEEPAYMLVLETCEGEIICLEAGHSEIIYDGRVMSVPQKQGERFVKTVERLFHR